MEAIGLLLEKMGGQEAGWWVYDGTDLGYRFNKETHSEIGIESWFNGNGLTSFFIKITTWPTKYASAKKHWENYEDAVKKTYGIDINFDGNRVNLVVEKDLQVDWENNQDGAIKTITGKLKECYDFLKELAEKKS